jgi:hypothetical protein
MNELDETMHGIFMLYFALIVIAVVLVYLFLADKNGKIKGASDYWEDQVKLRWVKWSRRKPDFSGSLYITYNGKNQALITTIGNDFIVDRVIINEQEFKDRFPNAYWLEELHPEDL